MPPRTLLSAGSNAQGQLATGDTDDAHSFTPCLFLDCEPGTLPPGTKRISAIACGANHTVVLLERTSPDGSSPGLTNSRLELWGSGDGSRGQLGPSVTSSTPVFRLLHFDLDDLGLRGYSIVHVATCWETTYVTLRSTGHDDVLLSMGADDFGDLGIGGAKAKGKQVDGGVHIVDLQREHIFLDSPHAKLAIKSVITGPHHVIVHLVALHEDGPSKEHLVGWGTSRHGQLGDWKDPVKGRPMPFISSPRPMALPHADSAIEQIAAGTHHTVFLHPSGRVSALGSNRKSQLTSLEDLQEVSDVGCTWNGTYAVVRRENAWFIISTGNHTKGQLGRQLHKDATHAHPPATVSFPFSHDTHELLRMTCGSEHILALFKSVRDASQPPQTEVWGWGWNEHGNLGLGHTQDQHLPVRLWPQTDFTTSQPQAVDIWAGCGTSWIILDNYPQTSCMYVPAL